MGDTLVPVGGLVTPGAAQPLTTIVPLDPMWVRFKVSESQYLAYKQRLREQAPLELLLADETTFPQRGRIENTLNQVDPKTGTLELQASFPNPRHTLLPGQFGRVRFQTEDRKNAILVPQRAVQQIQSLQTVFVVGPDNKAQARADRHRRPVGRILDRHQGPSTGRPRGGGRPASRPARHGGPPDSVPRRAKAAGNPWRASSSTAPSSRW